MLCLLGACGQVQGHWGGLSVLHPSLLWSWSSRPCFAVSARQPLVSRQGDGPDCVRLRSATGLASLPPCWAPGCRGQACGGGGSTHSRHPLPCTGTHGRPHLSQAGEGPLPVLAPAPTAGLPGRNAGIRAGQAVFHTADPAAQVSPRRAPRLGGLCGESEWGQGRGRLGPRGSCWLSLSRWALSPSPTPRGSQ